MSQRKNVVYSATRQWNPGDEFILRGARRVIEAKIGPSNAILYNRNPDARPDSFELALRGDKNVMRGLYGDTEAYLRYGFHDNSVKPDGAISRSSTWPSSPVRRSGRRAAVTIFSNTSLRTRRRSLFSASEASKRRRRRSFAKSLKKRVFSRFVPKICSSTAIGRATPERSTSPARRSWPPTRKTNAKSTRFAESRSFTALRSGTRFAPIASRTKSPTRFSLFTVAFSKLAPNASSFSAFAITSTNFRARRAFSANSASPFFTLTTPPITKRFTVAPT